MVVIFFLQCCYIHISHESPNKVFYIWCFYRYNYTVWVFHWGGKKIPVLQVQVLIPKGNRLPQSDLDTIWDRFFGIKLLMCVFELIFHKFEHPKSRYKRDTEGEHVFSVNKLASKNLRYITSTDRENMRLATVNFWERWKWRTHRAAISKTYDNRSTTFQKSLKYLFILR